MLEVITMQADYLAIFKPFYIFYTIFGIRTYELTKDNAKRLTYKNLLAPLVGNVVILICFILTVKYTSFSNPQSEQIYVATYAQYVVGYTLTTIINFYQSKNNFYLLSKLQEISRVIRNPSEIRRLRIRAWICCGLVVLFYATLVSFKMLTDRHWKWQRAMYISSTMVFEITVVNVAFVIYYLTLKMRKWMEIVNKFDSGYRHKFLRVELESSFRNIMIAFHYVNKVSRLFVLFHFVMTFAQSILYIAVYLFWVKSTPYEKQLLFSHLIGVVAWIIKGLTMEIALCISCELFYSEVESVRVQIICKYSQDYETKSTSNNVRHFGKAIVRIIDTNFHKLSACAMFNVDAKLPLDFACSVVAYIVVMLQFTL